MWSWPRLSTRRLRSSSSSNGNAAAAVAKADNVDGGHASKTAAETPKELSPAFAALGLPHFLLVNLRAQRVRKPTPVQQKTIPTLLTGMDAVVQAPTGTGKTLAYLLPVLARMDHKTPGPHAVVVAPTRELATQLAEVATKMAKASTVKRKEYPLRVTKVVGELPSLGLRRAFAAKPPHILVGTPQAMSRLMAANPPGFNWAKVGTLVLDEADQLLAPHFAPLLRGYLQNAAAQKVLVSATITPELMALSSKYMRNPVVFQDDGVDRTTAVDVKPRQPHVYELPASLAHFQLDGMAERPTQTASASDAWNAALFRRWFAATKPAAVLVFCASQARAEKLSAVLRIKNFRVGVLSTDVDKLERHRVMAQLRYRQIQVLLCTEMAARGLDMPQLTHVYNYDLPESSHQYVHRCGRVGRVYPDADGNPVPRPGTVVTPTGSASDVARLHSFINDCGVELQRITLHEGAAKVLSPSERSSSPAVQPIV